MASPVYARCAFPDAVVRTIFLAGPTPRVATVPSWRPRALQVLAALGFEGHVFIPEDDGGGMHGVYEEQLQWETEGLHRADVIVFWVPRDMATLPGLTTNDEWGYWKQRGRVVWGSPPAAPKCRYQRDFCARNGVPFFDSLEDTLKHAVECVREAVPRRGPQEVLVPSYVFSSDAFQQWRQQALRDGNALRALRMRDVVWVKGSCFMWSIWVSIFVAAEQRVKDNELVVGRLNVSSTVVYCPAQQWQDTKVVLVKEFRSAGGHILDLPGGSAAHGSALAVALEELAEEIDFKPPQELEFRCSRRIYPTLLCHSNAVFSVAVTAEVIRRYEEMERNETQFGVAADTEQTYVVVRSVKQLRREESLDWHQLGIVMDVVVEAQKQRTIADVLELYTRRGAELYGEGLTQTQHAIQCAQLAIRDGAATEVVLAAFLHDVGHLVEQAVAMPEGLGTMHHEHVGAEWLAQRGFSQGCVTLVREHVSAKRYLCYKDPTYHAQLSDASKATLELQGGPMDQAQAKAFEAHPLHAIIIKMRQWDEQGKDSSIDTSSFDFIRKYLEEHL